MSTEQIINLLVAERDKLDQAIAALGSPIKKNGNPTKNAASVSDEESPRKAYVRTPAQRRKQVAAMKAYWAKKKQMQSKS